MLQEAKCLFFCAHFFIEIVRRGSLSYNFAPKVSTHPGKVKACFDMLINWCSIRSNISC